MQKFTLVIFVLACCTVFKIIEALPDINNNEIDEEVTHISSGGDQQKFQVIFPGTKWCGMGDIASNDEDFGVFRETDMCCQAHDYCQDFIVAGDTKYNLTNTAIFTKVLCECDDIFRRCLRSTNSVVSHQVGATYFNILDSECFREDYPIVRCRRYSHILKSRCEEYVLDSTQPKQWQFFDNSLYWS